MVGVIYVVEWQKIADATYKPKTPEDCDCIVCAEIPDEKQFSKQHRIVMTLLMHGTGGLSNARSPCMVDGKCSKST